MKRFNRLGIATVLLVLATSLSGCLGSDSIVGSWTKTGTGPAPTPVNSGNGMLDALGAVMSSVACSPATELEFKEDGTLVAGGGSGRYRLLDNNRLELSDSSGYMTLTFNYSLAGGNLVLRNEGCADVTYSRR